jgi:hypothetical protein
VLYLGCYGLMTATGYQATATVTGGDGEGFCDVTWEDSAGRQHRDETDCSDEPVGSTFDVLVSGWPFPGSPGTPLTIAVEALVVGLPVCVLAGGRLLYLRRRAARWTAAQGPAGHPYVAAAEASATAWALTRDSRRTWAALVLGVICLAGFVVAVTVVEDRNAELRQSGDQAVGTVAELYPDSKYRSGRAVVRFTTDGGEWYEPVDLGANADNYTEGQTVTVFYDPTDPARMTIDHEVNQASWTVLPMILSMLAGLGLVGLAIVRTIRGARVTYLLWSGPWEQVRVDVQPAGERIAFHVADGSSWRSGARKSWPSWDREDSDRAGSSAADLPADDVPTDELVWWVADGTRAVFSPTMGTPLVLVRRRRQSRGIVPSRVAGPLGSP